MLVQPLFVQRQILNRLWGGGGRGEEQVFPAPKYRGNTELPFVAPNPRYTKAGENSTTIGFPCYCPISGWDCSQCFNLLI